MKNFLKIIPIPICGLILALVSLGNLLKIDGLPKFGNVVGLIGIALMCLVVFKIIFTFKHTLSHLNNHIVASVAPTFTMALMVICTYFLEFEAIQPYLSYIWLGIVFLQFVLMLYFAYFFLLSKSVKIHHVYPSWFIIFVGIGVISITSSNFYPEFGRWIFWVALSFYLVLLPIILYRVVRVKNMEESVKALLKEKYPLIEQQTLVTDMTLLHLPSSEPMLLSELTEFLVDNNVMDFAFGKVTLNDLYALYYHEVI